MRLCCTDCEGLFTKGDNAMELCGYFIPGGVDWFAKISKYDDWLADVVKKPGYKAGDTLKLIAPFLRAYGASNENIEKYSASNILLVPGAAETLHFIQEIMPVYIISTSYEPYIRALCDIVDFPFENAYCTRLDINQYRQLGTEVVKLKKLKKKIDQMPLLDWPEEASSLKDLSREMQKIVSLLDQIFWEEIPEMSCGRMLKDINPIGGFEKDNAVKESAEKEKIKLSEAMYFGDSITDVQAFQLVRKNNGLAVSFNGNKYAIREAEVAVLSGHTIIISILAERFNKQEKEGVLRLAQEWGRKVLRDPQIDQNLRQNLCSLFPDRLPIVEIITDANRQKLEEESSVFRKTVRGEKIGRLG